MKPLSLVACCAAILLVLGHAAAAKTFVFCLEGDPEALNPEIVTSVTGMNAAQPIFNGLVRLQGDGTVVPDLADSWTISPDGTEYTFKLRHGVKFHANALFTPTRDFNADDVRYSFERQWHKDPAIRDLPGGTFNYFEDMEMGTLLQSIDKIDDDTVRFRLTRPEAPFLADLGMPFAMMMSAEYGETLRKAGTLDKFDTEPIGTGPFRFVDYRKDVWVRYQAFADYWAGRPAVDTLVLSITPNSSVRLTKLKAGECQAMSFPNPTDAEKIERDPDLTLLRQPGWNVGYASLNASRPPFDDVRVRRAVNMAIDRETIVRTVYGRGGILAKNPLPPTLWAYNDKVASYPYDPAAAQALMAEAGHEAGFDIELLYMPITRAYNPDGRRIAEMVADDLDKIGIRAHLRTVSWSDYHAKVLTGDTTMAFYGWTSDNGDPDNFLGMLLGCHDGAPYGNNIAKWCDRDYNALIAEAKRTFDQTTRKALYQKAQVIAHDQAPWVPFAHATVLSAVRKSVTGFALDPFGRFMFDRVDLSEQ